ncbi:MAG: Uma2 family endonuclease [Gammaproteobacteria bacterium]|nr:Uma2 family endonuclease [Gammaproteobacteria bacterium]
MTAAPHGMDKLGETANGGIVVRLQPAMCPTEEQFFQFCRLNDELRIERDPGGEVSIMPPAGWRTGAMNAEITCQLQRWARTNGTGQAADSSAGYLLQNGAVRSPDASWVSNKRLAGVTTEQQARFLPACPDFVVELRSPTDSVAALKKKMAEYMACGTTLAWLIDPANRKVRVYRRGSDIEELDSPTSISGDPPLEGFRLGLAEIWEKR